MKIDAKRIGNDLLWLYLVCTILFSAIFVLTMSINEPKDFGSFIQAGVNAEKGLDPYSNEGDYVFRVVMNAVGLDVPSPNLNPPLSVIIFQAVAKSGTPEFLSKVWRLISLGLYVLTVLFCEFFYNKQKLTMSMRLFWALSLAGVWQTIEVGQIYMPLVALMAVAWVLMEKDKTMIGAGIALGLILAIKPNFYILILFLLASRQFRLVISSVLTFGLVSLLPIFKYGLEIYWQWLDATAKYNGYALPNNSFVGLTVRFQHPEWGTWLSIALIIFILFVIWRYKVALPMVMGLGVTASLLCSPIAWAGYTLFLLPYFYSQEEWQLSEKIGAAILTISFVVPLLLFRESFASFVIFGWLYGWGLLLILGSQIKKAITPPELPS